MSFPPQKHRILAVDSDATRRGLLALVYRDRYEFEDAASLSEAKERVAGAKYDLLLLESTLFDGTAIDLLRSLQAGPRGRSVEVILFVDPQEDVNQWRSAEAGLVACVEKPLDLLRLSESIDRAMAKCGSQAPSRPMSWALVPER